MPNIKAQTLKGFRDFLPSQMRKRSYVINTLKKVFESFGFEPLETPALEYEEILLGKYGDEGDKLMYRFTDNGDRKVALRYDQTVPLARVVAQYQNQLPIPFKRYQIQDVFRAENTQKGRFREFLQCDIDTVGIRSPLSDLDILSCVNESLKKLGFTDFTIFVNSRKIFEKYGANRKIIGILDKEDKIGKDAVLKLLSETMESDNNAEQFYLALKNSKPTDISNSYLYEVLKQSEKLDLFYSPFLARGLDYYTDLIFEARIPKYKGGSVAGGGRYDNLIGLFAGNNIPAVGVAFGFDRIIEAMDQLGLFPADLNTTEVLVTIFSQELTQKSLKVSSLLRLNNINTELWLNPGTKLDKQLKYADQKQIPYAVIVGPEEIAADQITLKDLTSKTQQALSLDKVIQKLTFTRG